MRPPQFDPERWRRLAAHLARARAKPTWDVEEREPKLALVERFRQALDADGESAMPARIERLEPATKNRFALLLPEDFEWLRSWAAEDPGSLTEALASFSSREADAGARFAAWATAAHCALDPDAALAVGSLFNFAVDPGGTPIVSHGPPPLEHDEPGLRGEAMFGRLESELGYERAAGDGLAARYRRHLRFAELVHRALLDDGVAVMDMLDVQSLIFIAALERDLWAVDPQPALTAPERQPDTYLAVCALYRNEAPYLAEWIEFHRAVGVERFFLYDNRSSDDHMRALAPHVEDGTVVLHEWPHLPVQMDVYNHCLTEHGADARWVAFIDLDEFLFSPTLRPLPEVLRDYEQYPGVGVNWAMFGTSGYRTRPVGLVIENYLRRGDPAKGFIGRYVKSIVQPRATVRCASAHRFDYRHGLAVDENGYPIHRDATKSVSFERLRINHYYTRSEEELRAKLERRQRLSATGTPPWQARPVNWEAARNEFNDEHDDLITAYAGEVRAALERAAVR
jgi:hypothetical protein